MDTPQGDQVERAAAATATSTAATVKSVCMGSPLPSCR
jgi:hypothetical protein